MSDSAASNAEPYLDHHSTTPLDERVLEAMHPYLHEEFGNAASSTHAYGWRAEAAVDLARERICELLGASDPSEIIFTSGATESNNLAILGLVDATAEPGHIVTLATEHPAVLDPCRTLLRRGWRISELPVDREGLVDPSAIEEAIVDDTRLVSVMAANNEIGVLQPIEAIAAICLERAVPFHTDAAQAAGKIALDAAAQGLDLVSVSGHKLYGPKGIGLLRVRKRGRPRFRLEPRQFGGGHEGGLRSGTLPVASVVGLARALELCVDERESETIRLSGLRDSLWKELDSAFPGRLRSNGHAGHRLAGNLNLSVEGVDGQRLLADLAGFALSSGSACSSASAEASHVLIALGHSVALARASLRFGLGRGTTPQDVARAVDRVAGAIRKQLGEV
ncbi:MAG: cysteine desulfurase [bacterium]|nr:cysteine desulfurase [bacterium]